MHINSTTRYRMAVSQVHLLSAAKPGSNAFRRRHLLLAAMAEYEQLHQRPEFGPAKPAPLTLRRRRRS